MTKILLLICFLFGLMLSGVLLSDGAVAVMVVAVCAIPTIFLIRRYFPDDSDFLTQAFLVGLLIRLLFGLMVEIFNMREFFGGDSLLYDFLGGILADTWRGNTPNIDEYWIRKATEIQGSGWGMNYLIGAIYYVVGKNIFAAQSFCAFIGAATIPMIYGCAYQFTGNRRVARISALLVALYPAFIVWSGQLLKDGLIVFLLVLSITMVLHLQKKLDYAAVFALIFALFGILSLRFYIFYMVVAATVGSFVVGFSNSPQAVVRRLVVIALLGIGLTYLGVLNNSQKDVSEYANLEQIQKTRGYLIDAGGASFGEDYDVSTTEGALVALPVGFLYLMLAPFPWQMTNFRQLTTLPDVLLWWASIPLLIAGLWYTIKNRLRNSIAILIFTMMITLTYSLFQGNVGMAYRQRTQIQVFLFIFIAVGWSLIQEKRENMRLLKLLKRQAQLDAVRGNRQIVS